jgi:predicted  nucleic acid-binding Zn-ribbon protein
LAGWGRGRSLASSSAWCGSTYRRGLRQRLEEDVEASDQRASDIDAAIAVKARLERIAELQRAEDGATRRRRAARGARAGQDELAAEAAASLAEGNINELGDFPAYAERRLAETTKELAQLREEQERAEEGQEKSAAEIVQLEKTWAAGKSPIVGEFLRSMREKGHSPQEFHGHAFNGRDSSKLLKRFPQLAYELNNWRCAARVLRGSDVRRE